MNLRIARSSPLPRLNLRRQQHAPARWPFAAGAGGAGRALLAALTALVCSAPLPAVATSSGAAAAAAPAVAASTPAATGQPAAAEEASRYVAFVQDFASTCVQRNGVQIQVRNTHPQRTVRVWLDRIHMGVGTGDRSRSELRPGAEPEALGCSRTLTGAQEWRIVRAQFVD